MKIMKLLLILYGLTSIFYVETLNCFDNKVRSWWHNFISRVYYSKWMIILIFVFFTMNIEIISLWWWNPFGFSLPDFRSLLQARLSSDLVASKHLTLAMSWMRKVTSKSSCAMRGTANVKGAETMLWRLKWRWLGKPKFNVFIKLSYPEKTFWYL